jgi:DNA sulfur modification protein DndC
MLNCKAISSEIQKIYLSNNIPWVIGFSGGKDSTATLQMVFYALSDLPKKKLNKEVHVLSNDTLVENPVIVDYVNKQLAAIKIVGKTKLFSHKPELFNVIKVTPKLEDTFWVNLIGKGYPSPNRWFRWCTERIKINPTSKYIIDTVSKKGKAIIVLGSRKAESSNRAVSMNKHNNGNRLRKHTLPNSFVYTPIEDLNNNEVWSYLLQVPSPWNGTNRGLLKFYRNACSGGECPFVVETGTQSCGSSRFGCWVCTVVDKDKSMENLIDNGEEWMEDLLQFRNWLYKIRQQDNQYVPQNIESKAKFGSFLLKTRRQILKRLLGMQNNLAIKLITDEELDYVYKLLENESKGQVNDELKKFTYKLPKRKTISIIADYDVRLTPRKRLGPMYFDKAKLIESRKVSIDYSQSSRTMYYEVGK